MLPTLKQLEAQSELALLGPETLLVSRTVVRELLAVAHAAKEVMATLDESGPDGVPYLLDSDDNAGEFCRRALAALDQGSER